MEDKNTRRYVRIPASWPVKCVPRAETLEQAVTETKDISAGGVRIGLATNLPVGTVVDIEIYAPILSKTISAKGQVVRSVPAEEGHFDLGIRFLEIDSAVQAELNTSIEKAHRHQPRRRHRPWWRKLLGA